MSNPHVAALSHPASATIPPHIPQVPRSTLQPIIIEQYRRELEMIGETKVQTKQQFLSICTALKTFLAHPGIYIPEIESPLHNAIKALYTSSYAEENVVPLFNLFRIMASHLAHMSAFSRAKCKKAITEVRKLIHTKCQTQDNALVKLWHSNNQMQEISGIVVQSGVFSMTDPFANSSYPFPTDRMIRGISYLVKPIKLPSQMFQHDITFTFPSDYGALLLEQQKDLSAEVLYGSRLLCYKKDDTQRRIVWPSCVLAVFISGYMKPVPIPRKVKRRIVNNAQADPSSARIIEVGGDFVANLTPFLRNGLNVLTIITNGTEEIDNYIIAVDFVALVTEARLRYDLGISKHTFSIDGSIQKLNAILDKFQQDDDIIMEESIDISLNCPLVGMRMDFPVRTTNCTHFQCFEMNSWLAMKHIHDVCPVCRCSFRAENIEVDVFQAFLCKFIPNSITTVTLLREGDIVCKGLGGNEMQVLKGKWQEMLKNARTTTGNASTNETDRPNKRAKTVK